MPNRRSDGALVTTLLLIPAVTACILLAAHFLRFYAFGVVGFCLLLPLLLLVRRGWAARIVQLVLLLGALVWARAGYVFAHQRMLTGEPWGRLAIIIGGVTLFTLVAGALFETAPLRRRYGLRTADVFRAAPPDRQ